MKRKQRKVLELAKWLPHARKLYHEGRSCFYIGMIAGISRQAVNALLHRHYPTMKFRKRGRRKGT